MDDAPPHPAPPQPRDDRFLWSAHALSAFGSQASSIALPLVLLASTGSVTHVGIVTFAGIVASLVADLPAGVLVERLPRRAVLILCDLARAVVFTLFTLVVLADRVTLVPTVVTAVVTACSARRSGPRRPPRCGTSFRPPS